MKKLNLMLHCGGQHVSREQLDASPTPCASSSWRPVSHGNLVERVRESLTHAGMSVVEESHGLSHEGNRYFGMLQVMNGSNPEDYGLVIGIRNSHDKSFPASLALGAGVFVCDNLSFSGEVKLARKHTTHILRDLPALVHRGVGMLTEHRRHQDERIACYKDSPMSDARAHDVIVNALDARVIGSTAIPKILQEWRKPRHEEFQARTAWSLFNAFTEFGKGSATRCLVQTQRLHGVIDSVCGLVS